MHYGFPDPENRVGFSQITSFCTLVFFTLLIAPPVFSALLIYNKNDLSIHISGSLETEYIVRNFSEAGDLAENGGPPFDYREDEAEIGIEANSGKWSSAFSVSIEDMSDDDHSTTEESGEIEVKEAYIDYDSGFRFRTGRWETTFGSEIFFSEESSGIMVGWANNRFSSSGGYFTLQETEAERIDHTMSYLMAGYAQKGVSVSVYDILIHESQPSSDEPEDYIKSLHNLAIHIEGESDTVSFMLEGNRQFGEYYNADANTCADYKGFAILAECRLNLSRFAPGVIVGYGSGEDGETASEVNAYQSFDSGLSINDLIVIEEGLTGSEETLSDISVIRIDSAIYPVNNLVFLPGIAYYRKTGTADNKNIGTEVDLFVEYDFNAYFNGTAGAGYLFAENGAGINDPSDAWLICVELQFSF